MKDLFHGGPPLTFFAVGGGSCSEISADSIGDYSICFKDNILFILFSYFEYRSKAWLRTTWRWLMTSSAGRNGALLA